MVDIRPFYGFRYNVQKVGDLSRVVAPPYDVITPEAQRAYHAMSEYNIIRLELGLDRKGDTAEYNKYTRAAKWFDDWRRDGILVRDLHPSMYVYEQQFAHNGKLKLRKGLIACLRLEDWESGVVLPHEETLAKPLADRLHLMRACHANLSPVFGLYEDETHSASQIIGLCTAADPAIELSNDDGERHRLWVIDDKEKIRELQRIMAVARVFIADGHHRYQTALRYRDQMREASPGCSGDEAFNFVMTLLVDMEDPGLVVLPTHRLLKLADIDRVAFEEALRGFFSIEHRSASSYDEVEALLDSLFRERKERRVYGAYGLRAGTFSILRLKPEVDLDQIVPAERSKPWRNLDVSVFHSLVIERILAIQSVTAAEGKNISFTRDESQAVDAVKRGEFSVAFFLVPPTVQEVRAVALAGDRMPQKSTYFHPKPLTGLVVNSLDGHLPSFL